MKIKELKRVEVVSKMTEKNITNAQAAELLGISIRQLQRLKKRLESHGAEGLRHGNRDKPSGNRKDEEFRSSVLQEYVNTYTGFGPTLASEKLHERGLAVDHETLRRWLIQEGLWERKRRRKSYRSRRPRKACFGEMIQFDGSPHDWFEGRRGVCCLMVMVEDATGKTFALFTEQETSEAAMRLLWGWIALYGLPMSLYCDLKNAYKTLRETTLEEQLAGIVPATAFQKSCETLGIEIKSAYSPQAKGRVERRNGILQDRLVKELRLRGISTIEEANDFLTKVFLPDFNERFEVEAEDPEDVHVGCPPDVELEEIFCFEDVRVVQNDFTIHYQGEVIQLRKPEGCVLRPKQKVCVRRYLDRSLGIVHESRKLEFEILQDPKTRLRRAG